MLNSLHSIQVSGKGDCHLRFRPRVKNAGMEELFIIHGINLSLIIQIL